ncbi:MAG: hypothetical protein AAGF79_04455 [Pseudomonadota bacterium]
MAFAATTSPRIGFGSVLLAPFHALARAVDWVQACNRIASEYEYMSHKSDRQLASEGLTRPDIADHIRKRHGLF